MSKARDKYNEREYARYTLRIRKDSRLHDEVEAFKSNPKLKLNALVVRLLTEYFEKTDVSMLGD